jgi:hypothetical protein
MMVRSWFIWRVYRSGDRVHSHFDKTRPVSRMDVESWRMMPLAFSIGGIRRFLLVPRCRSPIGRLGVGAWRASRIGAVSRGSRRIRPYRNVPAGFPRCTGSGRTCQPVPAGRSNATISSDRAGDASPTVGAARMRHRSRDSSWPRGIALAHIHPTPDEY